MTSQPMLSAPDIGTAENALRAALLRMLAGTGLTYERWVALRVLGQQDGAVPAAELINRLVSGLKVRQSLPSWRRYCSRRLACCPAWPHDLRGASLRMAHGAASAR
jgi:hypothetical protein